MSRFTRRAAGLLVSLPLVVTATVAGPAIPVFAQDAGCAVTVWGDEITHLAIQDAAAMYTEETGVTVDVVGKAFDTMFDEYATQAAAGTGPDLIIGYSGNFADWAPSGIAAPLEIPNLADFDPVAQSQATIDGKQYFVPLWLENIALIRNTDLVPEVPATMADLVSEGMALVADGKAELPISINLNQYMLTPFATSLGADWFPVLENGNYDFTQPLFAGPEWQSYIDQLVTWVQDGFLDPDIDGGTALDRFQSGASPFLVTGAWDMPTIKASGVPYAVSAIPALGEHPAGPIIGVAGLILNPKGQCTLAATDFATRFMATDEAQMSVYETGAYPPALSSALAAVGSDPDVKGFGEAAVGGRVWPNNAGVSAAVGGTLGPTVKEILKGGDAATLWPAAAQMMVDAIKADTTIPAEGN